MLKKTCFISDMHISEQQPGILNCLLRFFEQEALQAEALYILGDLFDVWIGDDDRNPHYHRFQTALAKLSHSGVSVYVMRGNRDFLLGSGFAKKTRVTLLPDPNIIVLYGQPVLLMHGDLLCTDDLAYQRFRRWIQRPWLQGLFLNLPLKWRQKIATRARKKSKAHYQKQSKLNTIQDVNESTVKKYFIEHKTTIMIHGHTHRPAIHEVHLNNEQTAKRIVLPAWHDEGSVLCIDEAWNMTKIVLGKTNI